MLYLFVIFVVIPSLYCDLEGHFRKGVIEIIFIDEILAKFLSTEDNEQ